MIYKLNSNKDNYFLKNKKLIKIKKNKIF